MVIKKISHATLWAISFSSIVILLAILARLIGPTVEPIVAGPLLTDIRAAIIKVGPDYTDILLTGTKARPCFLSSSSGRALINGSWVQTSVDMLYEDGSILPPDRQRISVGERFVRRVRMRPGSDHLTVEIASRCHPFWVTRQELFEIDASKTPAQVR